MMIKASLDRPIQSLFPYAIASLLILGCARFVLDTFKCNKSTIFKVYGDKETHRHKAVFVLPDDRFEEGCNLFEGKWVWDNVSYPIYSEDSCPYLVKQTTCQRNGRPDSFYQNWRWQPNSCNLPRSRCKYIKTRTLNWDTLSEFDALKLLDVLRDKRLLFIGDSVQRGQFESMVCMVQSVIPEGKKSFHRIPPMKIFKSEEYNASIEYYWAPFIVESISDHATNHTVHKRLVNLDSIAKHGKSWAGADYLVFESYVWWMYKPTINATYGSPDDIQEYNVTTAYELALETWSNWLESNINPVKQKVFFMSLSPTHLWSWEWLPGSDGNCFNETHPIEGPYWGTGSNLQIMKIVGDALQKLKLNVEFLNITQLSEYRKDAHTTVYGERKGKLLTNKERSDPKNFADCIHWCLPGVPDTWNQILYAYLLRYHQNVL